jgi:hypothetical protein
MKCDMIIKFTRTGYPHIDSIRKEEYCNAPVTRFFKHKDTISGLTPDERYVARCNAHSWYYRNSMHWSEITMEEYVITQVMTS